MLEEYYSRLTLLNSNPDLLKNKSDEYKTKLKPALNNVSEKRESNDEELEKAMTVYIETLDELDIEDATGGAKTRSLSLRKGTNLPRHLINDVTIMTLKNF